MVDPYAAPTDPVLETPRSGRRTPHAPYDIGRSERLVAGSRRAEVVAP